MLQLPSLAVACSTYAVTFMAKIKSQDLAKSEVSDIRPIKIKCLGLSNRTRPMSLHKLSFFRIYAMVYLWYLLYLRHDIIIDFIHSRFELLGVRALLCLRLLDWVGVKDVHYLKSTAGARARLCCLRYLGWG